MTGAESLVRTAALAGVDVCFANPGTTEMPLVTALDTVPGVRAVLGLFEGVCTGAADGYGRMANKPALTLLHLGPGFANGIANLHNARRARSPIVNLIGDHATWHVAADAPLTSDIVSLARPVSAWVRTSRDATSLSGDVAAAIAAAGSPPGCVASLIIPVDCQWNEVPAAAPAVAPSPAPAVDPAAVGRAARTLVSGEPAVVLLGAHALRERGLVAADRIRAATGVRLIGETFAARLERGAGRPAVERLGYFPEHVLAQLGGIRHLVLAGTPEPVAFFAYPGQPSRLVPEGVAVHELASPTDDVAAALEALADELGATKGGDVPPSATPARPSGALEPASLCQAVAALQPEGAIVVDEAATSGASYLFDSAGAPPHTILNLTGGAIGQGLPCATGAAIACSDRPVIAFQADGSALYTAQALWTMVREGLNVTVVVCANRQYRILRFELMRAGVAEPGRQAMSLTDLGHPAVDWVGLGTGFGVPSVRVERAEDLARELERSLAEPGPHLIEAVLTG